MKLFPFVWAECMYLPKLRKISDVINEMKANDPHTVITRHFIEFLIHTNKITALKFGDAWLVNLDELFIFLSAVKPDESDLADDPRPNERTMMTSGEIYRAFLQSDPRTIIRKPNLRHFVETCNIPFCILNEKWIIHFDEFIKAVNPKGLLHHYPQPKLRAHDDAVFDFKRLHPHLHVSLQMIEQQLHSPEVFSIKNGNRWIINYDELELAVLKAVNDLPDGKPLPRLYKKDKKVRIFSNPVNIKKFSKGRYTFEFKIATIEYLLTHTLTYKELVIKFWGIQSRKKIQARIQLVQEWEQAYLSKGKHGLMTDSE